MSRSAYRSAVLGIASRRIGGLPGTQRVVLVGILLNAVFLGLVQWALTIGDVDQATKAAVWLTGSLHGRGWEHVSAVGLALVVLRRSPCCCAARSSGG